MKVTVFGIGHVGLVQAAALAEVGHNVLCIDVDKNKIQDLKGGKISIYEPGLTKMVQQNHKLGRLNFTTDAKIGIKHSFVQFITVNAPNNKKNFSNIKYIITVAKTIARHMNTYKVVINKSTAPVGTTSKIQSIIQDILFFRKSILKFDVISNPEFLKEGTALNDCMYPDRIIIGSDNNKGLKILRELYKPFNHEYNRMITMDVRSAELTKYASNCMLATKISFMNEISNLAELLGADVEKVRQGMTSDSRIGRSFSYPGCGYGGSCFPKDIQALINSANHIGYQPKLLEAVEYINYQQKNKLLKLIFYHFGKNLQGKIFAVWGLSFKPNTDDMREASSRVLIESLWKNGAKVRAFDPAAMGEALKIYGNREDLQLIENQELALKGSDALVICTEWNSFLDPDFEKIKSYLKYPVIFDGRNIYHPEQLAAFGFIYYGIGRGSSISAF